MPWSTVSSGTLQAGDVVHLLGGTYVSSPFSIMANNVVGTSSCPVLIRGESDGGTVLLGKLTLTGHDVVVRDLVFHPSSQDSVYVDNNVGRITFQRNAFAADSGSALVHLRLNNCPSCVVQECSFGDDTYAVIEAQSPNVAFRGNRVHVHRGPGFYFAGSGTQVEGNDFTGVHGHDGAWMQFASAAIVTRNVFHNIDYLYPDKIMISGPARITNNTFYEITSTAAPTAAIVVGSARFDNNLVFNVTRAVGEPSDGGGDYNIFDPSVTFPYPGYDGGSLGTDRIAPIALQSDYAPAPGSDAIDSADPTIQVPSGGGTRADVGAIERGAGRSVDGRYCYPDGGS